MPQPLIYVLVLDNNRRDDTLACLASLVRNSYKNLKIIVLDNSTTDGTREAICSTFTDVQMISLTKNLGYAGNNNIGVEIAMKQGADWIFILNDDTILDPDCLAKLVFVGESDPSIGIVGPMVYHHDEPDIIQSAGGMLGKYWQSQHLGQNELDKGQFQSPHPVEWISGCSILVRKTVIEQVGKLDDSFFMYSEEKEWCVRASRAGWKIFHVPQAKIWHKGVQRDYQPKPSFTYYETRNHFLILAKHKAPLNVWILSCLQIVRTLASWSIKPKWKYKREHRDAMWRGVVDFLQHRWGQMSS